MTRKKVDPKQQSLFSAQTLSTTLKPEQTQVTHEGLYLGPVSPFTRGGLNAIEGARVKRGLSIAKAGVIVASRPHCFFCSRERIGKPLYRAVCLTGKIQGERFRCTTCERVFTAHRDECWSSPR